MVCRRLWEAVGVNPGGLEPVSTHGLSAPLLWVRKWIRTQTSLLHFVLFQTRAEICGSTPFIQPGPGLGRGRL